MNGVISASVSAGSGQRVASGRGAPTVTVPEGWACTGAAPIQASAARETIGRSARNMGASWSGHRRSGGERLSRARSARLRRTTQRRSDMSRLTRSLTIFGCLVLALAVGSIWPISAQEPPRAGGERVFVVAGEPPSFDAHREETFGMLHPGAPQYNTLLRVDPTDRTGTKIIGDLAESWTISPDKRTYTFKLRRGVKFHDGSVMTSADVKASYDKIIFPPAGVVSSRKAAYKTVEAVEAPNPDTIVFRLKFPEASFI